MHKKLDIPLYVDGYNISMISCMDLPIATSTGYFNSDNYYYYAFYISFLDNFNDTSNFSDIRDVVLEKLGLTIKRYTINDPEEMLPLIKDNINKERPVLLMVKYKALFYDSRYLLPNTVNHCFIISDYDSERSICGIRESSLTYGGVFKSNPMLRLQLTDKMLYDIWTISNEDFIKENSHNQNCIYCIEKSSTSHINSYKDLFYDIIKSYSSFNSNLKKLIHESEMLAEKINFNAIRRQYYGSVKILFDVMKRPLPKEISTCDELYREIIDLETRYLEFRDLTLSKIMASVLRKKNINYDETKAIVKKQNTLDNELKQLIIKTYLALDKIETSQKIHRISPVNLKSYFNNQAFDSSISINSTARFGDNGYLLIDKNDNFKSLQIDIMRFNCASITGSSNDNIVCNGQIIDILEDTYKCIMILGCAERENFERILRIEYDNGKSEQLTTGFTNIGKSAHYGEKIAWSGKFIKTVNSNASIAAFEPRIFAKTYYFRSSGTVKRVILPDCNKIHIFAISLAI